MRLLKTFLAVSSLVGALACPSPTPEDGGSPGDGDGDVVDAGDGDGDGPLDGGDGDAGDGDGDGGPPPAPVEIAASEQRAGDAEAGRDQLLNAGYVGCGIPREVFGTVFGDAPAWTKIDGRDERNADLAYNYNAFLDENDVEVVTANCLFCHAAPTPGQTGDDRGVIIGLGDSALDFTENTAETASYVDGFIGFLTSDPDEQAAARKWASRVEATGGYLVTEVPGVNPADNLAAILFAHRDQETLAWSDTLLLDPPPTRPTPTDVPAWWLMKKKHAMFYTASGQGDHARIQMTASTLCVDDVETAQGIDAYFNDVRAFIESIEAPPYPGDIDADLAADGAVLFDDRCARCHGTYGDDGSYPNLLVHPDDVGTDPLLATASEHFADRFTNWFNGSFYGELAQLSPQTGYVAPPLDGIWATAPYFHNASVPTLELVLNSALRPDYFSRPFDYAQYDVAAPGWPFTAEDDGDGADTYDTTLEGYGNQGHTYGDDLDDTDRAALVEYLKTL